MYVATEFSLMQASVIYRHCCNRNYRGGGGVDKDSAFWLETAISAPRELDRPSVLSPTRDLKNAISSAKILESQSKLREQHQSFREQVALKNTQSKPFSSTILESKSSNENHKPNEQVSLESSLDNAAIPSLRALAQDKAWQSISTQVDSRILAQNPAPKPYNNFHFQDIFGNFHRFFRPYTYRFRALFVRVYPQGYCYSDDSEIVITKSHKAIISQTSYPTHAFALPKGASFMRKLLESLKQCKLWARFYYQRLFKLHKVNGSLALLHQATNYYHFLSESIAALEQIRRSGLEPDYYLLAKDLPYQRQMWQMLQIPESKILPLRPHRLIQAQSLIVPNFYSKL